MAVRVASVTVTWTVLLVMPSWLAVTVVVPVSLAVSAPGDDMVAIRLSLECQLVSLVRSLTEPSS
ncbi:hypothetical protein D3C80_960020 [compost metagenome]